MGSGTANAKASAELRNRLTRYLEDGTSSSMSDRTAHRMR